MIGAHVYGGSHAVSDRKIPTAMLAPASTAAMLFMFSNFPCGPSLAKFPPTAYQQPRCC
jgi:hypothetical protein